MIPLFSVIIPTKNRTKELKRAINSVLSQTLQEFEVLVVDDHSDENILELINSYKDDRIKYFKSHKTPSNANVCRNIGIKNALGEYIAMLDSDDEWLENHIELKLKFLIENQCDGVFGSIIINDEFIQEPKYSRDFKEKELMVNYLLTDGWAPTPSHFYKTNCAKQISWNEKLLRHQDLDFSIRFENKFKFLPSKDLTCIVHWKRGEKRTECLYSQKAFMQIHKANIEERIYNKYNSEVYHRIKNRKDINRELIIYFKNESLRYIHSISFKDYLSIKKNKKSKFISLFYRVIYLFRVTFKV